MPLPNFLIIGPHKTGTTSLHRYLQQHPEVFMPVRKEARYFSYSPNDTEAQQAAFVWGAPAEPVKTWEDYLQLFAPATSQKAIGEASPCYLGHPHSAARIQEILPDVRLIASLRDPVDRAYSAYVMAVRDGNETRTFEDILGEEAQVRESLVYTSACERFLSRFPRERLKFLRAERLKDHTASVLRDVFDFLEVDADFRVNTSVQHNLGGMPRSRRVHRLLSNRYVKGLRPYVPAGVRSALRPLKRRNLRPLPKLDPRARARGIEVFREDILKLQDLLNMDFSEWLRVERD